MIPAPDPVVMVVAQVTGSGKRFRAFSRVDISSWHPLMMARLSFIFCMIATLVGSTTCMLQAVEVIGDVE
jgi:hypothetical protein